MNSRMTKWKVSLLQLSLSNLSLPRLALIAPVGQLCLSLLSVNRHQMEKQQQVGIRCQLLCFTLHSILHDANNCLLNTEGKVPYKSCRVYGSNDEETSDWRCLTLPSPVSLSHFLSTSVSSCTQLIEKAVRITKPGGGGASDLDHIESKLTSGFSNSPL